MCLVFAVELLEAYGHDSKDDTDIQPQKLESELFGGPGELA